MKYVDIIVGAVSLALVTVLMFMKGCSVDLIVSLVFAAVLIVGIVTTVIQNRKIKALKEGTKVIKKNE